jgi:hypothetical protein
VERQRMSGSGRGKLVGKVDLNVMKIKKLMI